MKFLNYAYENATRLGMLCDETHVFDLTSAWGGDDAPRTLDALILLGDAGVARARALLEGLDAAAIATLPRLDELKVLAPVSESGRNIFNVGRNYREHIIEGNLANGRPANAFPPAIEFFTKPRTALAAHGGPILRHAGLTKSLDYEVELAIVIGKKGHDIRAEDAMSHVFGYTILNDVTARDLQKLHGQWFKGKSLDTSCPLGPVVVHASAIADPNNLGLELDVDGELRQQDNTNSMIFDIATVIVQLSSGMTLLPGDVIATGTPKGVGFAMQPPKCLETGQVIRARVEGIGELVNTVVDRIN